jgi:2-dehydropantoate 2-reductase
MDIAIIGTGAIGGLYGARLAHGGHRVHFLLHTEYDYIKQHGLIVDSYLGDFSLAHPLVYDDISKMPPCDAVLFAAKHTANDALFPLLGPVLKPGGAIILMQNGFGAEQKLAALYPGSHIFGGMCFVCSYRESPGVIRNHDYERVSLAPFAPGNVDMLPRVASIFTGAGIDTETFDDLPLARWRKLMWNIPYNGLTVVMGCKTDFLVKNPAMRELVARVMEEISLAAAACGSAIEPGFADKMVSVTEQMTPYEPSMKLDFRAGRPMEIDAIYGNPIRFAAGHGYEMRYADAIRLVLSALETKNRIQ